MSPLTQLPGYLLLVVAGLARADGGCDMQSAESIWQDTHRRLQARFGATVPAPRIILYPDTRDLPDGNDLAIFGYYEREGQVLHVACRNGDDDWLDVALRHEASHHYLSQAFGPLPTWLNEGISLYMEVADEGEGKVAGHVNKQRLKEFIQMLKWGKAPPLMRLLTRDPDSHNASQYYAAYWALFYALMHHPDDSIQQQRRQLLQELLTDSHHEPAALRQHLINGLQRENASLADWELLWRRQIWDLRQ